MFSPQWSDLRVDGPITSLMKKQETSVKFTVSPYSLADRELHLPLILPEGEVRKTAGREKKKQEDRFLLSFRFFVHHADTRMTTKIKPPRLLGPFTVRLDSDSRCGHYIFRVYRTGVGVLLQPYLWI